MKRIGLLAAFAALLCSGCCLMDWTRARPRGLPADRTDRVVLNPIRDVGAGRLAGEF